MKRKKQGEVLQMKPLRLTGQESGVLKYDVLTALSVGALNGSPTFQTSVMRLIALVTARYNWRKDEFCVGQRDMARMWSVNERTVKREIKRLVESEIIICKRPGVRGRVGAYGLNYHKISSLTQAVWPLVGPDFDRRMRERYEQPETVKVVQISAYTQKDEPLTKPGTWQSVLMSLSTEHPNLVEAWLSRLEFLGFEQGYLRLKAPSSFFQHYLETHHMPILTGAVEREMGPVDQVQFE
jgi:hypothetical protein